MDTIKLRNECVDDLVIGHNLLPVRKTNLNPTETMAFINHLKNEEVQVRIAHLHQNTVTYVAFGKVRSISHCKIPMGEHGLAVAVTSFRRKFLEWRITLFAPKSRTVVMYDNRQEHYYSDPDIVSYLVTFKDLLRDKKGSFNELFTYSQAWLISQKGW